MLTRGKHGIVLPVKRLNLSATHTGVAPSLLFRRPTGVLFKTLTGVPP
jgi:hypothetical protein